MIDCATNVSFLFRYPAHGGEIYEDLKHAGVADELRFRAGPDHRDSLVRQLMRFLKDTALPNSLYLLTTQNGGDTRYKGEALQKLCTTGLENIFHLMCYAGRDESNNIVLLTTIKPAAGSALPTPLMKKHSSESPHLVLDLNYARRLIKGFTLFTESELQTTLGMQPHAVNMLIDGGKLDNVASTRVVIDPALFDIYFKSLEYQNYLVEVPLGPYGATHSVVIPLEVFLSFLVSTKQSYRHIEVNHIGIPHRAFAQISEVLDDPNITKLPRYEPKRPIMASFRAFTSLIAQRLRDACALSADDATSLSTSYLSNLFATELQLLQKALRSTDNSEVRTCWSNLCATTFGSYFVPLESFEAFYEKLNAEKEKQQPNLSYSVPEHPLSSTDYRALLKFMSDKLPHALQAAKRRTSGPLNFFDDLRSVLSDICKYEYSNIHHQSVDTLVKDLIKLFFGTHELTLKKIIQKRKDLERAANARSTSGESGQQTYYSHYIKDFRQLLDSFSQYWRCDFTYTDIAPRGIKPDVALFRSLPYLNDLFISDQECLDFFTR